MKKILIANIGWMVHYKGYTDTDKIRFGGSFPSKKKFETFLFQTIDNHCYGYVQPAGNKTSTKTINLKSIDPKANGKDSIDGVLVVWVAHHPTIKGTVVVGWFKNAKVYRNIQPGAKVGRIHQYNIVAKSNNCTLLPCDMRTHILPRSIKGGLGQANIRYISNNQVLCQRVTKYIGSYKQLRLIYKNGMMASKVTRTAEEAVTQRYEALGYEVKKVNKSKFGWSLEAKYDEIRLNIEIKETTKTKLSLSISSEEYKKMISNDNLDYRMCVVTNDSKSIKAISTFLYDGTHWVCDEDYRKQLSIQEKTIVISSNG